MMEPTPGSFQIECPLCLQPFESLGKLKGHWMIEHPEEYSKRVTALWVKAKKWRERFGIRKETAA